MPDAPQTTARPARRALFHHPQTPLVCAPPPSAYLRKIAACRLSAPSRITTACSPVEMCLRQSQHCATRQIAHALRNRSFPARLPARRISLRTGLLGNTLRPVHCLNRLDLTRHSKVVPGVMMACASPMTPRNQRAISKPTVILTRNVSSPPVIGTEAAVMADASEERMGAGGANPDTSETHSTRPSWIPDACA